MLKQSLLSLAVAGTLSASQFLHEVKEFIPQETKQSLNKNHKTILQHNTQNSMNKEQVQNLQEQLDVMMNINKKTFTDFLSVAEICLQKWVKEDKEPVVNAMNSMTDFLDIRLKQYKNIRTLYKKQAPQEIMDTLSELEQLSKEAKSVVQNFKNEIEIIVSIQNELKNNEIIEDFWVPIVQIKDKNIVMVKLKNIDENDFDKIDRVEEELNKTITSKYIDAIMVA